MNLRVRNYRTRIWTTNNKDSSSSCSSKSSDGLIDHGQSIATILEVDTLPLVVHVVLVVDLTVNNGGHHVDEEEHGNGGENESDEITGETDIDHTVSFEGAESLPQALVVGGGSEGSLLLAEAWNLHVHSCSELGLDLETFDHLNNLALLLVSLRVVRSDLTEVLINVVVHCFF